MEIQYDEIHFLEIGHDSITATNYKHIIKNLAIFDEKYNLVRYRNKIYQK